MIQNLNLSQDFIDNVIYYIKQDYLTADDYNKIFNFLKIKKYEYNENDIEYELSLLLLSMKYYFDPEYYNLELCENYGKIYINIINKKSELSNIYYLYSNLLYYYSIFLYYGFNNINSIENIQNKSLSTEIMKVAAQLNNKLAKIEILCFNNEGNYLETKMNILKLYEELYIHKNLYTYRRIIHYYELIYQNNNKEEDFNKMYFFINEALKNTELFSNNYIFYLKNYYELLKFHLSEENKLERIENLKKLKFYDEKKLLIF